MSIIHNRSRFENIMQVLLKMKSLICIVIYIFRIRASSIVTHEHNYSQRVIQWIEYSYLNFICGLTYYSNSLVVVVVAVAVALLRLYHDTHPRVSPFSYNYSYFVNNYGMFVWK